MRFGIATIYTPKLSEAARISIPNKRDYCALHNYGFEYASESLDVSRHPYWSKLKFINQVLPKYEWLLWCDLDAMIMNYSIKLETLVDDDYDIIICQDNFAINTGVFLMRNCPETVRAIQMANSLKEFENHQWPDNTAIIRSIAPEIILWEHEKNNNASLQERLGWAKDNGLIARVKIIPQKQMNAYPRWPKDNGTYETGNFICHCCGWSYGTEPLSIMLKNLNSETNLQIDNRHEFGDLFNRMGYTGFGAEVGVLQGEFSAIIRNKWKNGKMFLVDAWSYIPEGYQDINNRKQEEQDKFYEFVKNRFKPDPLIEVVRGFTPQVAEKFPDQYFDWVYLDANHSFAATLADIRAWWPKVRCGGMLCGHDFANGDFWHGKFGVESAVRTVVDDINLNLMISKEPAVEGNCFPSWYFIKPV